MGMRRLQGWLLIVSGLLGLLAILRSDSPVVRALILLGTLLLILGVPVVETLQGSGPLGLIGIVLIELGAIIALVVNLAVMGGTALQGNAMPLVSALAGALGRVIVGWLTTRQKVFAAWIGVAFMIEGLLNLIGGLVEVPTLAGAVGLILPLAGSAALIGYGLGVIRGEASRLSPGAPSPAGMKQ